MVILCMVVYTSIPAFALSDDGDVNSQGTTTETVKSTDSDDEDIESIESVDVNQVSSEELEKTVVEKQCAQILENCEILAKEEYQDPSTSNRSKIVVASMEGKVFVVNTTTKEYTAIAMNNNKAVIEKAERTSDAHFIKNTLEVEEKITSSPNRAKSTTEKGWKSVVKETYKNKFWYQNSSSGEYVRVGCKAKYKINYNKLSSSKVDNVRSYRGKVRATKNAWNNFCSSCIKFGVSAPVVVAAFVAALLAGPETVGVSILAGVLLGIATGITWGEAVAAAENYMTAKKSYAKVKTYYAKVKTYGTKY